VTTRTLTVELFTEELPPKALKWLSEAFADALAAGLRSRDFLATDSIVTAYATPRRLAVSISKAAKEARDSELVESSCRSRWQKTRQETDGRASTAIGKTGQGALADKCPDAWDGPDHLYLATDGRVECVWFRTLAKGQPIARGLQEALDEATAKLLIPKVMSYASQGNYYNNEKFVRPAHRLVALHGEDVVPVDALGLEAGRTTGGHRFLSRPDLEVGNADAYEETLRAEGKVIASFNERRAQIVAALERAAAGAAVIMPDALLDEVTALVEWPAVYAGTFDAAFLAVPQECLILTMQQNQKYFALADKGGRLANRFCS
jgi:glycyl-tRNA synthetase beta chain